MSTLLELNVRKSLSVIREFCDAVTIAVDDGELQAKKEMAETALNHLHTLFSESPGSDIELLKKCASGQPDDCTPEIDSDST